MFDSMNVLFENVWWLLSQVTYCNDFRSLFFLRACARSSIRCWSEMTPTLRDICNNDVLRPLLFISRLKFTSEILQFLKEIILSWLLSSKSPISLMCSLVSSTSECSIALTSIVLDARGSEKAIPVLRKLLTGTCRHLFVSTTIQTRSKGKAYSGLVKIVEAPYIEGVMCGASRKIR